jgi:hypothetical protein
MKKEIKHRVQTNRPVESKEFAGKAQMPKVLRSILTGMA